MDKKFITLVVMFFLTFGIFSAAVVFNEPLTQLTRAKEELIPSETTSLIFAWPITIKADGKSASTITVFARTGNNRPLINKPVTVTSTLGNIKPSTVNTDNEGKALLTLSSTEKGIAQLEAVINNSVTVSQKITVKFE